MYAIEEMHEALALRAVLNTIQGYNKHLTMSYLETLSPIGLLHNVHPIHRWEYAVIFSQVGLITEVERDTFKKHRKNEFNGINKDQTKN